ncbi:MAG: radical SAM family heme chaperone HemW [Ruminiclostridium sp.]|nr:radical SAM family heme chaperone HemW [Ruminiclostridium sp.]
MAQPLGIYIHIPFCKSKCDYCDFYSLAGREDAMDRYQKALLSHIKTLAPFLKGRPVDTIYFGGGTPSYYGEKRLREVLSSLLRHFSVNRSAEITLECNPDSVDLRSMAKLRRAGFNRVSLGMQSADSQQLHCIHRIHTPQQVSDAVQDIRRARFDNFSLDLIYGLPGQTMVDWERTLAAAIYLEPDHISCYGLKVEPNTPLSLRVEEGLELPDGDAQADLYLRAVDLLSRFNYRQYEISNFARPGKESRHNTKYWMGQEYVGFGPGAHSYFHGRRFSYVRDLEAYICGIPAQENLLEENQTITPPERAREYLLLRMRTRRGIEEWEYRRTFGLNFEPISHKLELFERYHWVEQSDRRWHFTPEGFLLSNTLILDLLDAQSGTLSECKDWKNWIHPHGSNPD